MWWGVARARHGRVWSCGVQVSERLAGAAAASLQLQLPCMSASELAELLCLAGGWAAAQHDASGADAAGGALARRAAGGAAAVPPELAWQALARLAELQGQAAEQGSTGGLQPDDLARAVHAAPVAVRAALAAPHARVERRRVDGAARWRCGAGWQRERLAEVEPLRRRALLAERVASLMGQTGGRGAGSLTG
jgi:hypothetical protein